jgi:LPS-assembly protein
MFVGLYSWVVLFVVLVWTPSAFADDPLGLERPDLPYHIKADSLSYDDANKTYMARGHVTIAHGNKLLRADAVDLNKATMDAQAWGNVHFTSGEDWLTGRRLELNLNDGTGTVYDGTLFVKEGHFHITGGKIEKTGEASYYIDDGRFTTCDGDSPAWKIVGKDVKVTIDGYGTVKHASFWAKKVPLLYFPYFVFPAKTTRQTGLLVPQFFLSDRDGFTYNQPFFWAINDSSDATVYGSYMDRRGFKPGLEYRYALGHRSKGTAMFDYLYDRQVDHGTEPEDTSGYYYQGFTGDEEDRLSKERWWFRAKGDQELPASFKVKLDMDLVSDQDYLREFQRGYSNYDRSNTYFYEEFGRDLAEYTDTVRPNQLSINRHWNQYSFTTDFRWNDDAVARENGDPNPRLQQLPHVQFDGSKQQLLSSPLYSDLESSYDYFWQEEGNRGHRADLHPRVYYPMQILRHLDFEPSVGLRGTLWEVDEYEDNGTQGVDGSSSREVFDFRADLSTEFWRTFGLKGNRPEKIRHTVLPKVTYDYVTATEQEDLPNFDETDRLAEKNLITYSITNYLIARSRRHRGPSTETAAVSLERPETPLYAYRDFCRLKFWQSYDIEEAQRDDGGSSRRPFSDIRAELEFNPYDCLSLKGDTSWSPYDGDFTAYNALLVLCDRRGDGGLLDYRYTQDGTNNIRTEALVKLFGPVSVYGEHEYNIRDGQDVTTTVGLKYEPQCWSLDVSYIDDRTAEAREFFVELGLYGLGKFGL